MKYIKYLIYITLITLTVIYNDQITSFIASLFENNPSIVINNPNNYYKNESYYYVKESEDFIPYSKKDLLNITYSVLNRGYDSFTFYCPKEYEKCLSDITNLSNPDNNEIHTMNNFISPFNKESYIEISYSTNGEITYKINKVYSETDILVINKKIDEIIKENIKDDMSDEDKILTIHDYIINHTKYDQNAIEGKSEHKSYSAYGALIEGYAICNGYADAMALFLDRFKIKNYKVTTDTHVWNAVYLNGKWLHIDLTWDDPITEGSDKDSLLHKFFLIDTKTLENYNIDSHNFDKTIFSEIA